MDIRATGKSTEAIHDAYFGNPRHAQQVINRVGDVHDSRPYWAAMVIVFLMGLGAGAFILNRALAFHSLVQRGVPAIATVTGGYGIEGGGANDPTDATQYWMNYRYTVNGEQLNGRSGVTQAIFRRKQIGDTVAIAYLPDNPAFVEVTEDNLHIGYRRDNFLVAAVFAGLGVGAAVAILLYDDARSKYRKAQMLSGRVIDSTHALNGAGKPEMSVQYGFRDPQGEVVKSMQKFAQDDSTKEPPARGTRVVVLYFDAKRFEML